MRVRELRNAVRAEFGDRGPALLNDLVLGELGAITAQQALDAGADVGAVWQALCRATDVPLERRHGAGLGEPKPSSY